MSTAAAARAFAIEAHGEQLYGDAPYVTHLDAVVAVLGEFGYTDCLSAGYLHDTLEDTAVTFAAIAADFGDDTARIVQFC